MDVRGVENHYVYLTDKAYVISFLGLEHRTQGQGTLRLTVPYRIHHQSSCKRWW